MKTLPIRMSRAEVGDNPCTGYRNARSRARILILALAATVGSFESAAAGFFEDLFGVAPSPHALAPAPSQSSRRRSVRPGQSARTHAYVETAPRLQKTRDILDDETLRTGDAIMTRDGIQIFHGGRSDRHTAAEFEPLSSAGGLGTSERNAFVALEPVRAPVEVRQTPQISAHRIKAPSGIDAVPRYVGP